MATEGDPAIEADLKVKEKQTVKKRQELLKSLQHQVDEVDRNVTNLAKSFDSLYEHLCNRSEELGHDIASRNQDKDEGDTQILSKTQGSVSNLIRRAKTVADDKEKAIWSLSKLIHFIHADREEICTNEALERCKALAIDAYLKNYCASSDQNGETLVELLEEQNKRLQEKYKLAREHVKIVSEREKIVNDDRDLIRERLKKLESKDETDGDSSSTTHVADFPTIQENDTVLRREEGDSVSGGADSYTCIPDTKYADIENELQEAKETISSLETRLGSVQTEDLSHEFVFGDVFEVDLVYTRDAFKYYPEAHLEELLRTAMTKNRHEFDLKVVQRTTSSKHEGCSLICCAAMGEEGWDEVLGKEQFESFDCDKSIILLFYEINRGRKACEDAQGRYFHLLEKFARTFTIPHTNIGKVDILNRDILVQDILDTIVKKFETKRKVIGCIHCKTPSTMGQNYR